MLFDVLVPLKPYVGAKSRLLVDDETRRALVDAFAHDVLDAALACRAVRRVWLVSDPGRLTHPGVGLIADRGEGDLNRALADAADRHDSDGGTAVLCADLPCLRVDDLTVALTVRDSERWYVADAAGRGTTMLVAAPGFALDPRFGADSAAEHRASGALPVGGAMVSLRQDVDTLDDLRRAEQLGAGPHTARVLASGAGLGPAHSRGRG